MTALAERAHIVVPSSRSRSALLGAVIVVAAVAAHLANPYRDHWLPKCPFHELTGLWCPGCGSTRAACALARGDVWDAIRHNVLFLPALLLLLWTWAAYAVRAFVPAVAEAPWAQSPFRLLRRPWVLFAVVAVFWVVRNLPGLPEHLLSR